VGIGLWLPVVAGLYAGGRLASARTHVGVGPRGVRVMRWIVGWLLYGYPILLIGTILVSRLAGMATLPRFDSPLASTLLALPFILAVLVVFQAVPWLVAVDLAALLASRERRARIRAAGAIAALGAFALYTPIRVLAERDDVTMRHYSLGAATGAAPLRIAFLADIQQDWRTDPDRARELYAQVNAEMPDIVLSGGDWINTGPDYIERAATAAGMLRSRLGTYSVRGDHEHFAYVDRARSVGEIERALEQHGVHMVANQVRWFEHGDKRIAVAFLNYNYIVRADAVTVSTLVAQVAAADYKIVVTHQLDRALAEQLRGRVDLVLAGHTHGGQVNPVVGLVHVNLARIETPYISGRYMLGERTTVIVTSGVGMSVVPIRYASPGSLEIIDLRL